MHVPDLSGDLRLIDLSARAKLRLRGGDRLRFLQGQVTNDVRRATTAESVYVCVLTAKGKLCADAFVSAGPDFLELDAEPDLREPLTSRLERYLIADDVEIEDASDTFGLLHVIGDSQGSLPARLAGMDLTPPVRSVRFGEPGIDIFCDRDVLPALKNALLAGPAGCRELNLAETEHLRIAAGVPRWGAELDENTLPPEAALEARAIDYAKGCYVGQEVISRLKSLGRVNRHLCRLRTVRAGTVPLAAGMVLRAVSADPGTSEMGRVTSAVPATELGFHLALGYVRRGLEAPGTRLQAFDPLNATAVCEVEVTGPPVAPA